MRTKWGHQNKATQYRCQVQGWHQSRTHRVHMWGQAAHHHDSMVPPVLSPIFHETIIRAGRANGRDLKILLRASNVHLLLGFSLAVRASRVKRQRIWNLVANGLDWLEQRGISCLLNVEKLPGSDASRHLLHMYAARYRRLLSNCECWAPKVLMRQALGGRGS